MRHHEEHGGSKNEQPVRATTLIGREKRENHDRDRGNRPGDILVEVEPAPIADDAGIDFSRLMYGSRRERNGQPVRDQDTDQNSTKQLEAPLIPTVSGPTPQSGRCVGSVRHGVT
jgi:hypothetical protein